MNTVNMQGPSDLRAEDHITRGEFSEARQDIKVLERQMIEVQADQTALQVTLNQILAVVQKQSSIRGAVSNAFSGLGGGLAVGLYALLHSLGKI